MKSADIDRCIEYIIEMFTSGELEDIMYMRTRWLTTEEFICAADFRFISHLKGCNQGNLPVYDVHIDKTVKKEILSEYNSKLLDAFRREVCEDHLDEIKETETSTCNKEER